MRIAADSSHFDSNFHRRIRSICTSVPHSFRFLSIAKAERHGASGQPAPGTLALWGLAALGVYHLVYVTKRALRRMRYRAYRERDVRDPSDQLRFVIAADFSRKKVMRFSEFKVFQIVEDEIASYRGLRVFAQTSLGEILRSDDDNAHSSINSKRVDILVVGSNGYPLLAVEYQGGGHYQNNAAARDAVKKEALRKAGVEYLEISESHSPDERRNLIRSALHRTAAPAGRPMPTGQAREFGLRQRELTRTLP